MKKKTNTRAHGASVALQTNQDFKMALILVSVTINLFVFITWLVTRVSPEYADQLASLI